MILLTKSGHKINVDGRNGREGVKQPMTPEQLKTQADNNSKLTHLSTKNSIRRRFETAAANGCYEITFTKQSYDGPFLLPESVRKAFLEELTQEGFKVKCDHHWWRGGSITISWGLDS